MDALNAIITTSLVTTVALLVYKFSTRNFDFWKKRGIPYIKPLPFIGNLKDVATFKRSIAHSISDMYGQIDGPLFGIWCLNSPFLVIRKPELVKAILNQDFNSFHNRASGVSKTVDPISSGVLFMLKNPEWHKIRRKMNPAFSSSKIKAMMPLLDEVVQDMLTFLNKTGNQVVDGMEICKKFTTDTITSCAFGIRGNSFIMKSAPFREAAREMFNCSITNSIRGITYFLLPNIAILFKIKFIPPAISSLLESVFWQSVEDRKKSDSTRNDLIDIIQTLKKDTSDDVILDNNLMVSQAVMFFIAGSETSSSAMGYSLYELSLNKSVQDKLRTEVRDTVAKYGSVTFDAIAEMSYMGKVVSESLRKYPVVPFMDRRCMKDYKVPGTDIVIEEGTKILIPVYALHHDAEFYPNPEKFDPERFSEENFRKIPNGAYTPFGSGPRACPGERFGLVNVKKGLAEIILRYEVCKTKDTPVPLIFNTKGLTLCPAKGLPMKFIRLETDHN